MDYYCDSVRTVAARFFGREHQPKIPAYWKLDPYPARYRFNIGRFEPSPRDLNLLHFDTSTGFVEVEEVFILQKHASICDLVDEQGGLNR